MIDRRSLLKYAAGGAFSYFQIVLRLQVDPEFRACGALSQPLPYVHKYAHFRHNAALSRLSHR